MGKAIYTVSDAREYARRRLPRIIFDFIDGSAGEERASQQNVETLEDLRLLPRVMVNTEGRRFHKTLFGEDWQLPFGIAPMGMCNLACPGADNWIARSGIDLNIPVCLSSAGSSSLAEMRDWSGDLAWFQLYFGQSKEVSLGTVERARHAGYDTLILTVDVPEVSRRIRDQQNGFNLPFRMTPRAFLDFALHPRWSIATLAQGVPRPRNIASESKSFDRKASRAGADWGFLQLLRDTWKGKLIVKGITSAEDASRVRSLGVDAIYVSNHGGRQLDSAPPAIDLLPIIRDAVGTNYPLLFDSGVRNGEDVVKALALGADFVMLGRPVLYALAAAGGPGLQQLLQCFQEDIDLTMAQIGASRIEDIDTQSLFARAGPPKLPKDVTRPVPITAAT